MRPALLVAGVDGGVDGLVERVDILEGLVGEMVGLEVAPDRFDVVEFGRVFGQPLDGKPVGTGRQRRAGELAGVDRNRGKTPGRSAFSLFPDAVGYDSLPVCRRLPIYPSCRDPSLKLGCCSFLAKCRN